jgi:RNA polymerase sigma factor (TIGR02999 family)
MDTENDPGLSHLTENNLRIELCCRLHEDSATPCGPLDRVQSHAAGDMNDETLDDPTGAVRLTELLKGARSGRSVAFDELFERLYGELRALAHKQRMRGGQPDCINTTMLVNEAFLRFAGAGELVAADRQHFLAYAANAMRSVIVDILRAEHARKRGSGDRALTLNTDIAEQVPTSSAEALRVHEALLDLAKIDQQLVRIVEMRFFAGLTDAEIADSLQISPRTVHRHWQKARLFLFAHLNEDDRR